ncbi:MAG: S26 family signal peptidase, partial [Planctomycetota bacterium]|nr:S26 family signal peptidase [Planctomycetota bacterium]
KGDIWLRRLHSDDPWRLARKPIDKQAKLQLIVHDNDRPARELLAAGWPESWRGVADSNWVGDPEKRSFRVDPSGNETDRWQTLRYTHFVPQPADWNDLLDDRPLKTPMPQVVRDEYAYNMRITKGHSHTEGSQKFPTSHDGYAEYWVGDLTLTCELHPESAKGEIQLELVEGIRKYRCRFDLATGQAQLSYPAEMGRDNDDDVVLLGPAFESKLTPGKAHQVRFCNVDDRLVVWVDGEIRQSVEMDLDPASIYQAVAPSSQAETPEDRSPIAVSVRGAAVRVAHLLIERDTYYTDRLNSMKVATEFELNDYEDDNEDQFLMLGDNSPRSNDGRGWREPYSVPRKLLIGKAFCIYWPHAVPFLNNGKGYPGKQYHEEFDQSATPIPRISVPFVPQVGRMKRIW